jgi:predicted  nucleic acid-binding Zn-ribbon protein
MEIKIRTHEEFRADRVTIEITGTGAEVRDLVDSEASTKLPSRNLYTDEEVAALQASEAELVAGPLRARINELERELTRRAGIIKRLENKVEGYDTDRHTERDRADRLKADLDRMRGEKTDAINGKDMALGALADARAEWNRLKAKLDEAETKLDEAETKLDEAETKLDEAETKLDEAETKLMAGHVCTGGCSGNQHVAFVGRKALTELENQVTALTRRIDNARVLLSDTQVTGALNRAVRDQHESGLMAQAIEKALDTLA